MMRTLIIAGWEFSKYLLSRAFMLATFVSPFVFAAILIIPTMYYKNAIRQTSRIGVVEFDSTQYFDQLNGFLAADSEGVAEVLLVPVKLDTSTSIRRDIAYLQALKQELDSLEQSYNDINARRRTIFQRSPSRNKRVQLEASYQELITTREKRDLVEIDFERWKVHVDSLKRDAVLQSADQLLRERAVEAYVVLEEERFENGEIEYHSAQPAQFLRAEPLKNALQAMLVEMRMQQAEMETTQIRELLEPVTIQKIYTEGSVKQEFRFLQTYLAPLVVVVCLFVSLLTMTSFLLDSVIVEKHRRISDFALGVAPAGQIFAGKLSGLGLLGVFQILIWMLMTAVLVWSGLLPDQDILFLNVTNAGIFLGYFVLAYLLFGAIALALAALSNTVHDSHQMNQWIRFLLLLPLALGLLVVQYPDAILTRLLSFVPALTPTFMILRTPLNRPEALDYYLSTGLMVVSIIIVIFLAIKIFRSGLIRHDGEKPMQVIVRLVRTGLRQGN